MAHVTEEKLQEAQTKLKSVHNTEDSPQLENRAGVPVEGFSGERLRSQTADEVAVLE